MKRIYSIVAMISIVFSMQGAQVAVVGCGHVGLAFAAVFADCGHDVCCVDIDAHKIDELTHKKLRIYEAGLYEALFNSPVANAIHFTNSIYDAANADVFYLCVPMPTSEDGECDRSYLLAAFQDVVSVCDATNEHKVICVKSTIPPGTMALLSAHLTDKQRKRINLIYNPEFLREGCALRDIYTKNPIVLGGECGAIIDQVADLYHDLLDENIPLIKANFETVELIKYAWNTFSAIRLAYVNEIATLSRLFGADIETVVQGFALSEQLLPTHVIKPGPGYGGSCLPKDARSCARIMQQSGIEHSMAHQALLSNENHMQRIVDDIQLLLPKTKNKKTVAILGLAFKANTNDIRYSPAVSIIDALIKKGIEVHAYDPQAIDNMKQLFADIEYYDCPYKAVTNADCIVVLTEWNEIKKIDLKKVASLCKNKILLDGRNIYSPAELKKYGFAYINMGKID